MGLSISPKNSAYSCFPASDCAHNSVVTIRMSFEQEDVMSGTHAILIDGVGVD